MSDTSSVRTSSFPLPVHAGVTLGATFLLALAVLGLALADQGRASLYLNPILTALTITLTLTLFTIAINTCNFARPTTLLPPSFTHPGTIALLLVLSLAYLAVAAGLVLVGNFSAPRLALKYKDFAVAPTVVAQSVCGIAECLALLTFASICYTGYCDRGAAHAAANKVGTLDVFPDPTRESFDSEAAGEKWSGGWRGFSSAMEKGDQQRLDVQITITVSHKVEPAPLTPSSSKKRKSRPPTWNYLSTFARPISGRFKSVDGATTAAATSGTGISSLPSSVVCHAGTNATCGGVIHLT